LGVPLTLISAPAAAAHAGALWFLDIVGKARDAHPQVALTAVLDCADRAGDAQAALAAGATHVLFTGPTDVADRLAEIAATRGATLLTDLPEALDPRGARYKAAACRDWLGGT
jgi:phosphoglycolate phosphatase-like HAD superfamily hydrolase